MTNDIQPVVPQLEFLVQIFVTLDPALEVGETAAGKRRIINITGGRFQGPKLAGQVLPGGADWQVVRSDGVAVLDARYTLQTDDGALIYVRNWGLYYRSSEVLAAIAQGKVVEPNSYYMRTTPILETGDDRYHWVNNLILVCSAVGRSDGVVLDFYQVT